MEKLIPALIAVNYFTNETNSWDTLFFPHIKPWLIPFSPEQKGQAGVAISFYEGTQTGDVIPWRAWLEPLCLWGVLVFLSVHGVPLPRSDSTQTVDRKRETVISIGLSSTGIRTRGTRFL